MAYSDVAALAVDQDFALRTIAAHATETLNTFGTDSPVWQRDHAWKMASAPGFGDAYASAVAGDVPRPGNDPAVISDAQILSAVQLLLGQGPTSAEPQSGEAPDPARPDSPEAPGQD